MGKVIAVVSGKGGTGKTTTAAAVASCLAALGHKTLCIDCDAGLKNLDLALGMADFAVTDFTDVLEGRMTLLEACHECPRLPNLFFLSAPAFRGPEEIDPDAMAAMLGSAREEFEYCLVDAPAGLGAGFELAARGADMAVVVTTGETASIRDAQRAAETARSMGVGEIRLVVNRVMSRNYDRIRTTVDDIIDMIGAQLIGIVCEDASVLVAMHEGLPLVLYEKRRAAYDFLDVARRIRGEDIALRVRAARL